MTAPAFRSIVLAVHPNTRGFGWAAFTGPFSPHDWGTVGARGTGKNETCLRKVEKLLDQLSPAVLVLEAFEGEGAARQPRLVRLGRALVALAVSRGIEVAVYPFKEVRRCFETVGAKTRTEIAEAVGRMISAFAHLVPPRRKAWEAEHWRLSVFCAVGARSNSLSKRIWGTRRRYLSPAQPLNSASRLLTTKTPKLPQLASSGNMKLGIIAGIGSASWTPLMISGFAYAPRLWQQHLCCLRNIGGISYHAMLVGRSLGA